MKHVRHTSFQLASVCALVLGAVSSNALAQLGPGSPADAPSILTSFPNGQLNHWYVSQSHTLASVAGESAGNDDGMDSAMFGLAGPIAKSVAGEYDVASAYAAVSASKLSVASFTSTGPSSSDPRAFGLGMADIGYVAIMDQPGTVKMDFHLSGTLNSSAFGSKSGVSLIAIGSGVDQDTLAALNQGDQDIEIIQAMQTLPQISNAHAQAYSSLHEDGFGATKTIEKDFSVSADGYAFACPTTGAGQAYCGKYLYAFSLGIYAASINNANADFAHTLTVTGLQLPDGATLSFDAGAAIPVTTSAVPEPSVLAMSLLGLGMMAGVATRRRQRN
jgi:hypothetical protein